MESESATGLLSTGDRPPVKILRPHGRGEVFLTCEHAGNAVPVRLRRLGLDVRELQRHIAWDPGAYGVARALSRRLDSTLVAQRYSRLVCDCNRGPDDPELVLSDSDGTLVPGNRELTEVERAARIREIFEPYHAAIGGLLKLRRQAARRTRLLMIHSFTPVMGGVPRPWDVGVLFSRPSPFARELLRRLQALGTLVVGENEPYSLLTARSETMERHGTALGLESVEIEVRQDHLATRAAQRRWADLLARVILE